MLMINTYAVDEVRFDDSFDLTSRCLCLLKNFSFDMEKYRYLMDGTVSLIKPRCHEIMVNNIMDIIPISVKVYGDIGEGLTNTITGCYILLTAADIHHNQFKNFGTSAGLLSEHVEYNMPGTFTKDDYLIHIDVTGKENSVDLIEAVREVHQLADDYIAKLRSLLKNQDFEKAYERHTYNDVDKNSNKKRIIMIKQLGGSGVMHDNLLLANQPCGVEHAFSIIDITNKPVVLTPNEYRDGAIRAHT